MRVWTSTTAYNGDPQALIDVLTDVDNIELWSPVAFDVLDGSRRLEAGEQIEVEGTLLGRRVHFDVNVGQADNDGLSLRCSGPFEIEVDYIIEPDSETVSARVATHGKGALARVLSSAATAMLRAGALEAVLRRVVGQATSTSTLALA